MSVRLDAWLVQNGLFGGRDTAKRHVQAGEVTVNGHVVTKPATPPVSTGTPTTFSAAYNTATASAAPQYTGATITKSAHGGAGVQFGAFSSEATAQNQVNNVKNKLGVNAIVEPTGTGLYRVRAYGLSETMAAQIKSSATANGIDSYVFH